MTGNLPPGTTPADIDKALGGEEAALHADVTVSVSAKALSDDSTDRKKELVYEAVVNGEWEDVKIERMEEERP